MTIRPPDYELPPPPPEEPYYPEPSNNFQQNVTSNPDYRAYTELCNKNSIDISELSAVVSQLSKMSEQLAKSQKQVAEMQQQLDSVQKHSAFKPLVQSIKTIGTVIFAPVTVPAYLLKNAEKIITDGAKNAVENFGKLGVKALNFTANLLKIKPIVTAIGKQAKKEFTASDKIINNIENFSKAYHGVGAGFRNMGRALTGKEAVAPKEAGKLARALETPFKKHSEITKKIYSKCRNLYKALDTLEKAVEKPKEQKQQYTFTVDNLGKIEDKNEIKEPPKDRNKDIKKDTDERSERDD